MTHGKEKDPAKKFFRILYSRSIARKSMLELQRRTVLHTDKVFCVRNSVHSTPPARTSRFAGMVGIGWILFLLGCGQPISMTPLAPIEVTRDWGESTRDYYQWGDMPKSFRFAKPPRFTVFDDPELKASEDQFTAPEPPPFTQPEGLEDGFYEFVRRYFEQPRPPETLATIPVRIRNENQLAFSHLGDRLFVAIDSELHVYHAESGEKIVQFDLELGTINCIAIANPQGIDPRDVSSKGTGNRVDDIFEQLFIGAGANLALVDAASGKVIRQQSLDSRLVSIASAPLADQAVGYGESGSLYLFTANIAELRPIEGATGVCEPAISPDGSVVGAWLNTGMAEFHLENGSVGTTIRPRVENFEPPLTVVVGDQEMYWGANRTLFGRRHTNPDEPGVIYPDDQYSYRSLLWVPVKMSLVRTPTRYATNLVQYARRNRDGSETQFIAESSFFESLIGHCTQLDSPDLKIVCCPTGKRIASLENDAITVANRQLWLTDRAHLGDLASNYVMKFPPEQFEILAVETLKAERWMRFGIPKDYVYAALCQKFGDILLEMESDPDENVQRVLASWNTFLAKKSLFALHVLAFRNQAREFRYFGWSEKEFDEEATQEFWEIMKEIAKRRRGSAFYTLLASFHTRRISPHDRVENVLARILKESPFSFQPHYHLLYYLERSGNTSRSEYIDYCEGLKRTLSEKYGNYIYARLLTRRLLDFPGGPFQFLQKTPVKPDPALEAGIAFALDGKVDRRFLENCILLQNIPTGPNPELLVELFCDRFPFISFTENVQTLTPLFEAEMARRYTQ